MKVLVTILKEIWGLFVGEGPLALVTLVVVLLIGFLLARGVGLGGWAGVLLGVGIMFALVVGLGTAVGEARKRDASRREASRHQASQREPAGAAPGTDAGQP